MTLDNNLRANGKTDVIGNFMAFFTGENVLLGGKAFPLGQISTDVLNMSQQDIIMISIKGMAFSHHTMTKFLEQQKEINPAAFSEAEEELNRVLDLIVTMPLYRELAVDWKVSRRALTILRDQYLESLEPILTPGTPDHQFAIDWINQFGFIGAEISTFRVHIGHMLDAFFDRLPKRGPEAYAHGVCEYFKDPDGLLAMSKQLPEEHAFHFLKAAEMEAEYVPMPDPADKMHYVIGERMVFHSIGDFLRADFFRGLQHGNAPRRCHNCHKFFLLTAGYNTCYCNNIAPGETERTCRKVGAHKKAAAKERTPAQMEYQRVYNRLKTQKSRGKISVGEWNTAVAQALDVKDRAERGELSDEEMRAVFEGMGRG